MHPRCHRSSAEPRVADCDRASARWSSSAIFWTVHGNLAAPPMRTTGLAVLLFATSARAGEPMEPDDLPAPQPEIARSEPKISPPAVPAFEPPVIEPGVHRPRELRLYGERLRGAEIRVR